MDFIVAYDISTTTKIGERRLVEVAKVCEEYGVRVQKSVFEARLGEADYQRFIGELNDVIDQRTDTVLIYRIPGDLSEWRVTLGRTVGHEHGKPWLI